MIYFKQYGKQRTGTNYLKALIENNFVQTHVFPSIFGWKHGHPVDPDVWLEQHSSGQDVYSVDKHLLRYKRAELEKAIDKPLNLLISIKDPYAFVVSYKKFRRPNIDWQERMVKQWCRDFNQKYRAWNKFCQNKPHMVIRYENLIEDYQCVLEEVHSLFDLQRKKDSWWRESRIVRPSTDLGVIYGVKKFDPSYYKNKQYLKDLPGDIKKVISDTIDWELMSIFKYNCID